jgi:hypothetical protein
MKRPLSTLALGVFLAAGGCQQKEDPTKRPGFVDTSTDPGKVMQTMTPVPKNKNATTLTTGPGGPGGPSGAAPSKGPGMK